MINKLGWSGYTMVKKFLLLVLVSFLFSGFVVGMPVSNNSYAPDTPYLELEESFSTGSSSLVFIVDSEQTSSNKVVQSVSFSTSSVGPELSKSMSKKAITSGSGSSLTISEMKIVMNGGRNYNPFTKKWGYRDAMRGERRNNFLLSWEAKRAKVGVIDLLPEGLRYSK